MKNRAEREVQPSLRTHLHTANQSLSEVGVDVGSPVIESPNPTLKRYRGELVSEAI